MARTWCRVPYWRRPHPPAKPADRSLSAPDRMGIGHCANTKQVAGSMSPRVRSKPQHNACYVVALKPKAAPVEGNHEMRRQFRRPYCQSAEPPPAHCVADLVLVGRSCGLDHCLFAIDPFARSGSRQRAQTPSNIQLPLVLAYCLGAGDHFRERGPCTFCGTAEDSV